MLKSEMEWPYRIAAGRRVYAIGDIHGCLDELKSLSSKIDDDIAAHPDQKPLIVYLGDYIDRGPDSKGVIEFLIEQQKRNDIESIFLKGNHEAGFFEFFDNPMTENWLRWGGRECLESYGVDLRIDNNVELAEQARSKIPKAHFEFLSGLDLTYECDDYFFVHAGINPVFDLDKQKERDLTCIREPFLSWDEHPFYKPFSKCVVHGHSLYEQPSVRAHRIGVDTGCYDTGVLTAAVLFENQIEFLQS